MFVGFSVGKWIQPVCNELYELVSERTQWPDYKHKITFCTDGNEQNENAITTFFHRDCVNYGQVIKARDSEGNIIGRFKRLVLGTVLRNEISIAHIDGFCSKLRARIGCFVRKTRNFAKRRKQIKNLLHITQVNHNFIESVAGETPGMKEHLVKRILRWEEIFDMTISVKI